MIAPVLIAASVALFSLQTDEIAPPREDKKIYDIRPPTGEIGFGTRNAFDGFGQLFINGVQFEATDPFELIDFDDRPSVKDHRTIYALPLLMQMPDGTLLEVSRKIYIPWDEKKNYARYYDRIRNVTDLVQTLHITFGGKIGGTMGETEPRLFKTGKGWAVIDTNAKDDTAPHVGILFDRDLSDFPDVRAPERQMQVWFDFNPSDHSVTVHYVITLGPSEEIAILNFVTQDPDPLSNVTPDDLNSESIDGAEPAGGGPTLAALEDDLEELWRSPDFDNLSDEEKQIIINFLFADTDVNMDGRVNILDMIIVRNDLGKDPGSGDANPRSDVNADTSINILDMILVRNDLGFPF